MDLQTLRETIEETDVEIIQLIGKRLGVCRQVRQYKDHTEDPEREAYLRDIWLKKAEEAGVSAECAEGVLNVLLRESKRFQSES